MEDYLPVAAEVRLLADMDGKYINTSLDSDSGDSNVMSIISQIDSHMSNLDIADIKTISDIEERLTNSEKRILLWDSDESMIWDSAPDEAFKYLRAVDEIRRLIESLETSQWTQDNHKQDDLLCHAHNILQLSMAKLEEEFTHLLLQCHQLSENDVSFRSSEEFADDLSSSSFGEDSIKGRLHRDSGNYSDDNVVDLIIHNAHPDIKCIAEVMFLSNYDKECCQAYINIRKDVLNECLSFLRVEKLSIEEVLQTEWKSLNGKISRWNKAMKVFIRVYLLSEQHLCDHIFGDLSHMASSICFYESVKGSILQLLNFGEAISVGPSSPEKLFRILDMYETLADLLDDMKYLFEKAQDSCILDEYQEVMLRLIDLVRVSVSDLKYSIQSNTSTVPFSGGGVHPLTKYVVNYAMVISDYGNALNIILEDMNTEDKNENQGESDSSNISPVALVLLSITAILETNLDDKAKLYQDASLQHFFMMNNIYYMVKKVKDSDLQLLLGDDWIRTHKKKYRQHAVMYERISWNPILHFLRDEGIKSTSNVPSKTVLKERFKEFNHAFEEIYKVQTAWNIPYPELQEDLRISISLKLPQAYRTFTGRYASHLNGVRHREKFIKYSQEDLENYILDFFAGSAKSLHNSMRR